jgi:hypothetical protein
MSASRAVNIATRSGMCDGVGTCFGECIQRRLSSIQCDAAGAFHCTVPGLRHDGARDNMHPSRNDYDTVGSSWRGNPGRNKDG